MPNNIPHIGTHTPTFNFGQVLQQIAQPQPLVVLPTPTELAAAHAAALQQFGSGNYLVTLNRTLGKLETWNIIGAFGKRDTARGIGIIVDDKTPGLPPDYVTFYIHRDAAFMGFPKTKFTPALLAVAPGTKFKFGSTGYVRFPDTIIAQITNGNTFLLGVDAGMDLEDQYSMGDF